MGPARRSTHDPSTQGPTPAPAPEPDGAQEGERTELGGGLQARHLDLIALGGVIGAGLFVGSGVVIHDAGPAAVLSFLAAGVITVVLTNILAVYLLRMISRTTASNRGG